MSCPFHTPSSNSSATTGPHPPHPVSAPVPSPAPTTTEDPEPEVGAGIPIPHPPEKLFLGNLGEIDPDFAVKSFWRLANIHGPIFKLNLVKRNVIVISNHELINEVCDDTHYEKYVTGVQETIRVFVKNGLFTAYGDEEVCFSLSSPDLGVANTWL